MHAHEKLLNKWLFATTRYLDSHGNDANAGIPLKILSAPEMKTSAFTAVAMSLAFAVARMPAEALVALNNITPAVTITGIRYWNHLHAAPREFYFDTQPDRKREIDDPAILALLKVDQKSLKSGLLGATAYTIMPFIAVSVALPFLTPIAAAVAVPLYVNMVTGDVGRWWRADQALKGNWNVTTFIPTPDAKEVMKEEVAAMPVPTPRMMS